MRALDGSNATDKAKVLLFFLDQLVLIKLNAVVDSPKARHHLVFALRIADRNVVRLRIVRVKSAQFGRVGVVQGQNKRTVNKAGE